MQRLKNFLSENKIFFDETKEFKNLTTYGIGGRIKLFIEPCNTAELKLVLKFLNQSKIKFFILGNGSKILASDRNFDGVVLKLGGDFKTAKVCSDLITAGGGTNIIHLAKLAAQNSLSGLEFATGIPASLGGAIVMNAGAYGGNFSGIVKEVNAVAYSGEEVTFSNEQCGFGYRKSIFQSSEFVVAKAILKLEEKDKKEIENLMLKLQKKREESQPKGRSCGSVFKNNINVSAGELIEKCGLKGAKIKDAEVSTKHANFILNSDNASCKSVLRLINKCKRKVYKKFKIKLNEEIIKVR